MREFDSDDEPFIDPKTARAWLLDQKLAVEVDGNLSLPDDGKESHLSVAGLAIALGAEPRRLTETYAQIPDHPDTLSDSMLRGIAQGVVDAYRKQVR